MRVTSSGSLPARRRADLAQYVREHAQATVAELAGICQVSADTVRRVLAHGARHGVLTRTHGGAVPMAELATADTPLMNRRDTQREAKERIGRAAARLVENGETVIINGGTTALEAARALVGLRNLPILPNNLLVPSEVPQDSVREL